MKNMIVVDRDFLSSDFVALINRQILSDSAIPFGWTLNNHTNVDDTGNIFTVKNENVYSSFQFVSFVDERHPLHRPIVDVFEMFAKKHNIDYSKILRIKINLIPRAAANIDESMYHMPHIDSDIEHKVFIYYVNSSDGDTVFFDQYFDGTPQDKLSIRERVTPIAGTGAMFDGFIYHSSSSPIRSDFRCIINMDFI